ncbi:MAG: DEAD/DEAH box helicase, partial [Rickettsiales bacterium]|nr:DEAD/DEAH box helicase [Rickettsiales bacterium]
TPIENSLTDLWSLLDFFNPGLLGTLPRFNEVLAEIQKKKDSQALYGPIKKLISPYILRRLKTDKNVIKDLPDKIEIPFYCHLTPEQAKLYQKVVDDLQKSLKDLSNNSKSSKERTNIVLQSITRFKQIINHPAHLLRDGDWSIERSDKFMRLAEISQEFAARQDKVLIFTHFKEIIDPLYEILRDIFGRPGLILHGKTPVKDRQNIVDEFQKRDGPPFFLLTLRAGGTGLNLTEASQVIHFDRWWNPAVENQATDRAYRIGQEKNVLVHKAITLGTLEEKIDNLLRDKKELAEEVLGSGEEIKLYRLDDEDLLKLVFLNLDQAVISN